MVSPANQHIACAIALGINAGILQEVANTGFISKNKGKAALAFYYLFNVVFSFTYTPLQGVIPAEALETTTRSKGLALSGFMVSSISFISQFATPIGLANISTNYFWIFVGWDVVESIFWYFFWYAYSDSVYTPLTSQIPFVLTPATTVSNPRAELWNSWSGFTSSPTLSKPPSTWTRSLFRRMVPLPRRSKPMLELRFVCRGLYHVGLDMLRWKRSWSCSARLAWLYKYPLSALCTKEDLESCLIWDFNLFREQYNKIRMDTGPSFNLCTKFDEFCINFKALIPLLKPHKVSERANGCVETRLNLGRGPNG